MEYTQRRISYVQIQVPSSNQPAMISYTVRPFEMIDGVMIDAPISMEKMFILYISPGEMGTPCQDFSSYLLERAQAVEAE